ncbi:hypothetical protein JYB62_13310 [Algoriphagus lutimaris]|uniref:DUF6090 family protein n=1 Tax=Algoriphagus lutimaris TaxID=613197 RepID=UPI00196B3790|nr:DUF6090 family protein [Algoriphagus lutimaris]MBN3520981.1 hypothetical protein [Algoriphagus lutimaris]
MNTKYFKYALGEIILVVIGILIALSINTWNEDRKDRIYEQKMLNEIYRSLINDASYIRNHTIGYRIATVDSSIKYFDQMLLGLDPNPNNLKYYFERLTWGLTFQINEGPYEGLKANGLDKIRNDSLRNTLMRYFDFAIPRYEELIEWKLTSTQQEMVKISEEYKGNYLAKEENGEIVLYRNISSPYFIRDHEFLKLLALSKSTNKWNKDRFDELLKEQSFLIKMLEKELSIDPAKH